MMFYVQYMVYCVETWTVPTKKCNSFAFKLPVMLTCFKASVHIDVYRGFPLI